MSGFPTSLPGVDLASGLARVAGNEKLYARLLRKVADEAPATREQLSASLVKGDAAAVREGAHSLKGAAGNLSITAVAEAAGKLEEAARTEDFSAMFALLDVLDEALRAYVQAVETLGV